LSDKPGYNQRERAARRTTSVQTPTRRIFGPHLGLGTTYFDRAVQNSHFASVSADSLEMPLPYISCIWYINITGRELFRLESCFESRAEGVAKSCIQMSQILNSFLWGEFWGIQQTNWLVVVSCHGAGPEPYGPTWAASPKNHTGIVVEWVPLCILP
jgi:hypothetical protein